MCVIQRIHYFTMILTTYEKICHYKVLIHVKCSTANGHLTEKLTLLSGVLIPAILNLLRLDPGLRFEFLGGELITDTLLSSFVVDSNGSGSTVSLRI